MTLDVEAPEPPMFLSPQAVECFNEFAGYGIDMNAIAKPDSIIIGLLASEFTEWIYLDKMVKAEGFLKVITTDKGFMREGVNLYLKIRDSILKVILIMLSELGLTPVARSKLQINEGSKQGKSALAQFLAVI